MTPMNLELLAIVWWQIKKEKKRKERNNKKIKEKIKASRWKKKICIIQIILVFNV